MGAAEQVQQRLDHDHVFFAENCLKIVGPGGVLMPLKPKEGQVRLYEALEKQRAAGRPMRAIILKARKLGFSTAAQGMLLQRAIRREHHSALVVAHDNDTAGTLHDIGALMFDKLPPELKPRVAGRRRTLENKHITFGDIYSELRVDNAKSVEGGRGFTYRSLHLSEVAFWPYVEKLTAVLNAVPEEPDTLVILESTANGQNFFQKRWDEAVNGESSYVTVFAPWFEEPAYRMELESVEAREAFKVGDDKSPWGEDEPELVESFGLSKEQLLWRRRAIVDKCESKLEKFKQEYPSTPEEAFIVSGKHRFSVVLIGKALKAAAEAPAPEEGMFTPAGMVEKRTRSGSTLVPTAAEFAHEPGGRWRVWEHPEPDGQYVLAVDVAGEDEDQEGQRAYHAIQVINHKTLMQAAEWRARIDHDLLSLEAFLAGIYWHTGWMGVEITGSWGTPVVRSLWRSYGYKRLYFRVPEEQASEEEQDRLGWDTNRRTKPFLEQGMAELLREGSHGIRSRILASELSTYVRLPNGKTGPEKGKFSDLLMAYMIAQHIAREKPIRPDKRGARRYWQPSHDKTVW